MNNILDLIPQRPPFVMVSNVRKKPSANVAVLHIDPSNIFVEAGVFTEPGLVEHMAQSSAAIQAMQDDATGVSGAPAIGFIGAIKDLKIYALPAVNSEIETQIEVLHMVMNAQIVKATTWRIGEEIASCELKIFLQS